MKPLEWRDPTSEAEQRDKAFNWGQEFRFMVNRVETLREVDCAECGKAIDKTAPNAYNDKMERVHWGCLEAV